MNFSQFVGARGANTLVIWTWDLKSAGSSFFLCYGATFQWGATAPKELGF